MILKFNRNDFSISKFEIKGINDELLYRGIYDFSYKNRLRIYDANDNELGYIQYKNLSSINEIALFDIQDNKIAYIDKVDDLNNIEVKPLDFHIIGDLNNWNIKVVDSKDNVLLETENESQINLIDETNLMTCLFCILAVADINELNKLN